ncbi:MAG: PHP domain-containing protein [Ideonella sp.]|jgi:3',5'-nucleoside bisphosphate phosphatase|nr:PHP domain-containing protein [Ideonella sp.]MBL0148147.1 PHP domain-containing protein [Ideonella sp.]
MAVGRKAVAPAHAALPTIPFVHTLNADLHSHSTRSDGTLSPRALAQRASGQQVQLWALTDHDDIGGQHEAAQAARELGLDWLSGVEISVSFAGETVHIVGLGMDVDDVALHAGLARIRLGRAQRAHDMAEGLAMVGLQGAYEGALRYVSNPDLVSRTHFARWLVETGVCTDFGSVFRRYLSHGKPGFVDHRWAGLGEAVRWITQAGGLAVIAHPGRYRFTPTVEFALFSEFKAHGGAGVEVVTASHGLGDVRKYAEMADEFDLYASRGSDFHSPNESRLDLGQLPDLAAALRPIWQALTDRVRPGRR